MTLADDGVDAFALVATPLLSGDCTASAVAFALEEDAALGLGAAFFLLLLVGVLRGPRGLPLGQPWCFFGFVSSAAAVLDIVGGGGAAELSSGGVRVWMAGADDVTSAGSEGGSGTCATSEGCWAWWTGCWNDAACGLAGTGAWCACWGEWSGGYCAG